MLFDHVCRAKLPTHQNTGQAGQFTNFLKNETDGQLQMQCLTQTLIVPQLYFALSIGCQHPTKALPIKSMPAALTKVPTFISMK